MDGSVSPAPAAAPSGLPVVAVTDSAVLTQQADGLSMIYGSAISWASPTQPLPMELNPRVVFERMFGDGSTVEQRAARRKRD